ncbi:hypothetical protein [Campylobacter mucosalis]|uniref:Lipoprotein n=1 Tax=Campylobacter mucosalis CCUG 21559 TaxID=1032067 RepID=A0A6G5QJ29_9BACT|nr:hypothetical protein [Campylobacter mucosalis]QCD45670.1 hypothetical protein CMUC_1929 [Campylobacter mucosalis CCUG 21559]
MKFGSIVSFLMIVVGFSGCCFSSASYENFAYKRNAEKYNNSIPKYYAKRREIYDNNRYIYKFRFYEDPRCAYAFFTNRDDKPERVIEWVIISGKEYCIEQPGCGSVM